MRTRAVQLLVNEALPPELRNYERPLDARDVGDLMHKVALTSPGAYASVLKRIGDIGRNAAYWQGESMGLDDLEDIIDVKPLIKEMHAEVAAATRGMQDPKEKRKVRETIWLKWSTKIERAAMEAGKLKRNSVADSVVSGARGKPLQLRAMLATPGVFENNSGGIVPVFAERSYSRGVSPAEWLAGTFGARSSVVATKRCLHKGTLVRMADGSTRAIETIKAGDIVLGANEEGETFPTRVVRKYDQGLQEVRRWTFRIGASEKYLTLEATEDHKILATSMRTFSRMSSKYARGDKSVRPADYYHEKFVERVGETKGQKFAAVTAGSTQPWEGGKHEPLAFVLGLLAGDGCLTKGKQGRGTRLIFSCADASLLEDLNAHLFPLGLKATHSGTKDYNYDCEITRISYKASDNASIVVGTQGFVKGKRFWEKETLHASGMLHKYAHEKALPSGFRTWSYESMCWYLAGLYSADGGISVMQNGTIVCALFMSARKLIEEVADIMLWLFGCTAGTDISVVEGITRDGVKSARKHALHGFNVCALHELKRLQPIFARMMGAKGRLVRALLENKVQKQNSPFGKAYRLQSEILGNLPCFDLEVEHKEHLFVLANGLIVSNSTARGGFWGKMLVQVAAPVMVTTDDCGTTNGIDLDPDDSSLRNRFLAQGIGKLPGGVQVDRKVLAEIRNNHKPVIVRSAMTCEAKKGVCAKCLGAMPDGSLAPKGYAAGITAAQAASEPVTQGGLNCLVLGTLVRMADFSVRKIEDIKVNEMVLGADVQGNTFPVRVSAVWNQGTQPVWNYTYQAADGWVSTVESTMLHELLGVTQSHDIAFKLLPDTPGLQALITSGMGDLRRTLQVSKVFVGDRECRDISVQHPDELFVLANGLIVSNTKHVSGTAKEKKSYSGIEWLERFVQVPDNFPDRAPLAETEGRVLVEPAPQGGNYVKIGDRTHYVPQHLEVKVKSGDMVEAGDVLSDGIVRPDDVVRLRGIGEGRRYYANRLKQMLDDGGTKADARNTEVIARAAINHVRVADFDDFDEGVLPDDIVPYEKTLGRDLPEDAADTDPEKAVGKYLYKPVLHYTIGTKLTPKMSQHLKKVGIGAVTTSAKPPGFEPTMQRLQTQSFANDDWLASMHTSYLGKQLAQGAQRAQDTNIKKNIHFAPRLAFGENFGTNIEQTGEF